MAGYYQKFHLSCTCGKAFLVEHAFNSLFQGRFANIVTQDQGPDSLPLKKVCSNLSVWSLASLQQLCGEVLNNASANSGTRIDVAANGFWGMRRK